MIQLLILIVVIGFVLYLINTFVPMQPPWKMVFNGAIILVLVVYLLRFAGLF